MATQDASAAAARDACFATDALVGPQHSARVLSRESDRRNADRAAIASGVIAFAWLPRGRRVSPSATQPSSVFCSY